MGRTKINFLHENKKTLSPCGTSINMIMSLLCEFFILKIYCGTEPQPTLYFNKAIYTCLLTHVDL